MIRKDINIELPDHVYDHFAGIAEDEGLKIEVLLSDIVSQNLESWVAKLEAQHGI